jgi:predicted RND superfamily exporter protein
LFIYWVLEGRASLGLANLVPIVVTVAFVAGSMRYLGFSLNAFTATVLAMTIGLGIDYSVHLTHRYIDERRVQPTVLTALSRTVYGTGGALLGSVLTTVFGIGVLVLSVFPAIGDFGLLTGLSVIYAFLSSLLVLPAALVVWERLFGVGDIDAETPGNGSGVPSTTPTVD